MRTLKRLAVFICCITMSAGLHCIGVLAEIRSDNTPPGTIVHTIADDIKGKDNPSKKAKTVRRVNMSDELHVLGHEGSWVSCYIDTGVSCERVWINESDLCYSEEIIAPVDLSAGEWYMLTYPDHGEATGEAYQAFAVDINLPNNADEGMPVFALADGVVTLVVPYNGSVRICYHDAVTLRSGTVLEENTFYSWMGHMSDIQVAEGDEVKKGEIIGYISNKTEKYKDLSPHLHFSVGASSEPYGKPSIPISPYWLAQSPLADASLYCDDQYGNRNPEGLYENGILNESIMP